MDPAEGKILVRKEDLYAFQLRALKKCGFRKEHASVHAEVLTEADYRGIFSHGVKNLELYVDWLLAKEIETDGEPELVRETAATACVEGNRVLGSVSGKFAMDLAIRKAKEVGVGWVCVRGSTHYGMAGWYSMRALEHGLLGFSFSRSPEHAMVPTRAARMAVLSTNPISVATPARDGDSMVLDMATTVVAHGKVKVRQMENQPIPVGWGVDAQGKPCTDPDIVLTEGGLLPLGGLEETSGYKGYGLALMVEALCWVLSGAANSPTEDRPQSGHCFVAIDPEAFAPRFKDRMSDLLNQCRNLEPAEGEREVLVPGDPERQHMAMCDRLGAIPLYPSLIASADAMAARLGIEPLKRLS